MTELIAEFDNVVKAGSPERRIEILRQVAGLFLLAAERHKRNPPLQVPAGAA